LTPASSRGLGRRALWLGVCLAAGLGVGTGGQWLTGNAAWFLAVPACVAVGWFFLADPQQCLPETAPRRKRQTSPDERVADD
jgi:hypothetical protein